MMMRGVGRSLIKNDGDLVLLHSDPAGRAGDHPILFLPVTPRQMTMRVEVEERMLTFQEKACGCQGINSYVLRRSFILFILT